MSLHLKEIVSSVENLVKKIHEKRDFILRQINGKECVSSAQMTLLLNSFVDQIVDNKDIKPDPQLIVRSSETDPHKKFKDDLNREKEMNRELEAKVEELKNDLKIETSHKNNFEKLYNNSLINHLNKEIELKDQIKELQLEIQRYKKLEEVVINQKNIQVRDEVNVKVEPNEEPNKHSDEVSDEDSNEELNEELNEEKKLRNLCLNSKPFVMINNIEIIKEIINIESSSDTEEEMDLDINNGMKNDSNINENNMNDETEEEVVDPNVNERTANETQVSEKYSIIKTRSLTKYVCNSKKCKFFTESKSLMCQHIKAGHEIKSEFITDEESKAAKNINFCQYPSCGKYYSTKSALNLHIRTKHKAIYQPISRPFKRKYRNQLREN